MTYFYRVYKDTALPRLKRGSKLLLVSEHQSPASINRVLFFIQLLFKCLFDIFIYKCL
jgi:hypothetical protein